ncbi:ribosomal L1 domain-containing protein 1 [Lepisosteus oculatus]|uniref:ribosomal L1 domain-containing protein 1 n=1 Tax=Lepisosteus oculatus TaxID=7918 RepID=UPI0035F51150
MATDQSGGVELDRSQVKKAAQALLAYLKSTPSSGSVLLDEHQHISLLFTLWKVPKKEQTIRIPLPHGLRLESGDVCLFTKDEPNMTSDQTERFYKRLLSEKGVKGITQVMPFRVLKKEYKSFEAKRRLLGNFDLFLADDRVRRLLPSHIGKHFYQSKKAPLSVDLQGKQLARDMTRLIQGSTLGVSNKGPCCMARVAHSEMSVDQVVENIAAAFSTVAEKLPKKGKSIKIVHLKSQSSVSLPIYTSDLSHLALLEGGSDSAEKAEKADKPKTKKKRVMSTLGKHESPAAEEEEIPQLVPIETPQKKARREAPARKELESAPQTVEIKGSKPLSSPGSLPATAGKQGIGAKTKVSQTPKKPLAPRRLPGVLQRKTPPKKTQGSSARSKLSKSAKKSPRTPLQKRKKRTVPQSC